MRPFDLPRGGPPAIVPDNRPSPPRLAAPATFLSQLIAERDHLAPQRARRRAPVGEALRSYAVGGRIAVRRLPPGYRMSIDV
ncbi:MAG TPA: hypothetical protein VHZ56_01615 [Devosia sp.]|nr:hypothetical protein [Devosia sp.]